MSNWIKKSYHRDAELCLYVTNKQKILKGLKRIYLIPNLQLKSLVYHVLS